MKVDDFGQYSEGHPIGQEIHDLIREMYPICRSITGEGVRRTLDIVERWIPLRRHEVPSGTRVFDWEVPREWNIRDAFVADASGRRLIDFRAQNLHVVSYSLPVDRMMSRAELEPHLYTMPDRPDWIPYRTSYYDEGWGFCLAHRDLQKLGDGPFHVRIDSELAPGSLTYAECVVPGTTQGQAIVFAHSCHPSMANDSLSGVAIAAALARELLRGRPRLTWRFIFAPATIGSITWLSRNEELTGSVQAGLVLGPLGDAGDLTYKRSRRGNSVTDRAALQVLRGLQASPHIEAFEPYGYDERQFCSPGFNLPVGRFTRSANGKYPQYHTSADDLSLVLPDKLRDSFAAIGTTMAAIDFNRTFVNLSPKGEPQLGKRGLYGAIGGGSPERLQYAMLWVLNLADGTNDVVEMAERSSLDLQLICRAAELLEQSGLLKAV